jgi:hypothetical protein
MVPNRTRAIHPVIVSAFMDLYYRGNGRFNVNITTKRAPCRKTIPENTSYKPSRNAVSSRAAEQDRLVGANPPPT